MNDLGNKHEQLLYKYNKKKEEISSLPYFISFFTSFLK